MPDAYIDYHVNFELVSNSLSWGWGQVVSLVCHVGSENALNQLESMVSGTTALFYWMWKCNETSDAN